MTDKRSYAKDPHDRALRLEAKSTLKYPPVRFDERRRGAIATGFTQATEEGNYDVCACCIGYDHAHFVIARHDRTIEKIARHLKGRATMSLTSSGCHPLARYAKDGKIPTPWSLGSWSVFVDDIARALRDRIRRASSERSMNGAFLTGHIRFYQRDMRYWKLIFRSTENAAIYELPPVPNPAEAGDAKLLQANANSISVSRD